MTKIDETLSETFNIEPMKGELIEKEVELEITDLASTEKIDSDYDSSRDNLKELLEKGKTALEHSLEVAKQSEHPRAFEVVGNLIKQLADVNQQLMDIHHQKKKLEEPSKTQTHKTTNNSTFVGSTAELGNLINNMTKENK